MNFKIDCQLTAPRNPLQALWISIAIGHLAAVIRRQVRRINSLKDRRQPFVPVVLVDVDLGDCVFVEKLFHDVEGK